jgi:CRP/FNR family transcriptional regulator, cyclic AMP receptor protein
MSGAVLGPEQWRSRAKETGIIAEAPMEKPSATTPRVRFEWEAPTGLPLVTRAPGDVVLSAGSQTHRLMILKRGAVVVLKDSVEIARVNQPGAVFGEIGALLKQPHSADVLALEYSEFYVADANLLLDDPLALLYVARITAARLLAANNSLVNATTT